MSAFSWGLLLKPFIGLAILAALWFSARLIAWALYLLTPDCKVKRWVFKDWIAERATARKASAPRPLK